MLLTSEVQQQHAQVLAADHSIAGEIGCTIVLRGATSKAQEHFAKVGPIDKSAAMRSAIPAGFPNLRIRTSGCGEILKGPHGAGLHSL